MNGRKPKLLTIPWGGERVRYTSNVPGFCGGRGFPKNSVQFSHSVVSDSLWPHGPSMPGLPVHHQLTESTQTHVHWVGDAIQPSHPLSSPSRPTFNLSQYQGLFKWVSSSHQVAKVLECQLQHQSFQWTPVLISFRMDWLDLLAAQIISFCLTSIEVLKGLAYSHWLRYSWEWKKFGWLAATQKTCSKAESQYN